MEISDDVLLCLLDRAVFSYNHAYPHLVLGMPRPNEESKLPRWCYFISAERDLAQYNSSKGMGHRKKGNQATRGECFKKALDAFFGENCLTYARGSLKELVAFASAAPASLIS